MSLGSPATHPFRLETRSEDALSALRAELTKIKGIPINPNDFLIKSIEILIKSREILIESIEIFINSSEIPINFAVDRHRVRTNSHQLQ